MVLMVFKDETRARELGMRFVDGMGWLTLPRAEKMAHVLRVRAVVLDVYAGATEHLAMLAVPKLSRIAPVITTTDRLDEGAVDHALAMGAAGVVFRGEPETFADRVNEALAMASRVRKMAGGRGGSFH